MTIKNSNYLVFVDESGDHIIAKTDPEFPLLVLAFIIIEKREYCRHLLPHFAELKLKYFPDVNTIFHERDIKKQRGDFKILMVPEISDNFFADMNKMMSEIDYKIVSVAIDKRKLGKPSPANLYEMAVAKGIDSVHAFLKSKGDDNHTTLTFEARGKNEDGALRKFFHENFGEPFDIFHHAKSSGGLGLQFADMIARPIGIHLLHPKQENRAWNIIEGKLCDGGVSVLPT